MFTRSAIIAVATALGSSYAASTVSGVFTSIDECVWSNGGYEYPAALPSFPSWMTTLSWTIDGSLHHKGDSVVLDMPCVFKMTANSPKFSLDVDGTTYADCTFYNGEDVSASSQLKCNITQDVSEGKVVKGKVTVPIAFNAGLTGSDIDIKCSKALSPQHNSFTFSDGGKDLTGTAKFEGYSGKSYSLQRTLPASGKALFFVNTEQLCDKGYDNGVLGVTLENAVDCDTVTAGFAKTYNAFGYLEEYTTEFPHSVECHGNSLTLKYDSVPEGYTPFIAGRSQSTSEGHQYTDRYTCKGSSQEEDRSSIKIFKGYENADVSTDGKVALKVGDDHNSTHPDVAPDEPISVVYETTIRKVVVTKTCDLCAHETVTVEVPCDVYPTVSNGKVGFITTEKQQPSLPTEVSPSNPEEVIKTTASVNPPITDNQPVIPTEEPKVIQNIMEGARVPMQLIQTVEQGPAPSPTTTTTRTVPPTEVPCEAGEGCEVKTVYQEVICKANYCEMTTVSWDVATPSAAVPTVQPENPITLTPTSVPQIPEEEHVPSVPQQEHVPSVSQAEHIPSVSQAEEVPQISQAGKVPPAQSPSVPVVPYEGAAMVTVPQLSSALLMVAAVLLL